MKHTAIRNTHPMVVQILEDENVKDGELPFICWDKDKNIVKLDKDKFAIELARLQANWDSQDYSRKRKAEYPKISELVVALYDTQDRAEIDKRRADVKKKYPKE